MADLQNYKITNADVISVYVQKQPDVLTGSPSENKKVFDDYPSMIKNKFNDFVDATQSDINSVLSVATQNDTARQGDIAEINNNLDSITLASTSEILAMFE